jgi:hypothetical protein
MGLDGPALQLIFNVVMITGVTSLALICHLLKRDNQKLTVELDLRQDQGRIHSEIMRAQAVPSASMPEQSANTLEEPGCEPESTAAMNALPMMHQDIRQYVARRAQHWIVPSATKTG